MKIKSIMLIMAMSEAGISLCVSSVRKHTGPIIAHTIALY